MTNLQFVFQPCMDNVRHECAGCTAGAPVLSDGQINKYKNYNKKKHFWSEMVAGGLVSFCSGTLFGPSSTEHSVALASSVCGVIGPWPAFCASDPCPISTGPNETISPVHFCFRPSRFTSPQRPALFARGETLILFLRESQLFETDTAFPDVMLG